ncbi:MAG: DUF1405 domain-containing protein [Halobacteriaceae archaeon]
MRTLVPERVARRYLEFEPSLWLLVAANALGILVGLNFYLDQMLQVREVLVWPLLMDSPLAMALLTASLLTFAPVGRFDAYPDSPFLAVLNTVAFASLVKYGLWTALTLNLFFGAYFPAPWAYFGILFTHLVMVGEAFLLPFYARTSRLALGVTALWLVANDVADYGFGLYPHLEVSGPGPLAWLTPLLTVLSVGLAAYCLDR